MKVFGEHKRAIAAVVAASALLGLAACAPSGTGTSSPASSSTAVPSVAESAATAPPSPSAEPGASATVGAVVSGFPQQLLPLMPGATVQSTSFNKTVVPATASLVGSIPSPAAAVFEYYTAQLEAQGFKAIPGEAAGTVPSKDFHRGDNNETASIAVVETAGVSTFTVGANVAAESVK